MPTLPEGTIHAEHVWKRFRKDRHRKLLRDELERVIKRRHRGAASGWRWALRDVNVLAEPGESVGLVGANGSGKSTTLRILAGVTYPHSGRLQVRGRVGALIEVRAGIHPDLTGRENIYLYGSMLGLTRKAVARRFDDIVAFAELDSAIDRQVKHFSSGMQMRLGFSIAAFLEPDILLVDEVLAVGDANFQQKCMDRMRAVLQAGTTIVFVSHDLPAVEAMCSRGIWLHNGMVRADGPVRTVLSSYRRLMEEIAEVGGQVDGVVRLLKAEVTGPGGESPSTHETLEVRTVLETSDPHWGLIYFGVSEGPATPIFVIRPRCPPHLGADRGPLRHRGPPPATGQVLPVGGDVRVRRRDRPGAALLAPRGPLRRLGPAARGSAPGHRPALAGPGPVGLDRRVPLKAPASPGHWLFFRGVLFWLVRHGTVLHSG